MSGGDWRDVGHALPGVLSSHKTAIETEFVSYVEHWFWRERISDKREGDAAMSEFFIIPED